MYIPPIFKNEDLTEVKDFIRQNAFGILVGQGENKILATHIPLLLSKNEAGEDVLLGHVSKANPQLRAIEKYGEVLVVFQGPHTYISPSWYDHENVPTWNYVAVHIYGKIRIIEGEELLQALRLLVDKYEADSKKPVSVDSISKDYLKQHLNGITGFEIKIGSIEAAKKLSQNRDDKNYKNIIHELEKRKDGNSTGIAEEMKKVRPKKINISNGKPEDIAGIFRLYEEATAFQKLKGSVHWPAFEKGLVETEINENRQWKLMLDDTVACVWATTFSDPQIWEERNSDPSLYIHRIATDGRYRGRNMVSEIVAWARKYAKANGKKFIRIDTVGENPGLIRYYQSRGFKFLGLSRLQNTGGLPSHYYNATVCLFEIALNEN